MTAAPTDSTRTSSGSTAACVKSAMAPVLDRSGWLAVLGRLVHGNGARDCLIYVQVTRGVEPERNHVPRPAAGRRLRLRFHATGDAGRDDRARHAGNHGRGPALGALRHQDDVAARQRAASLAGGGCGGHREHLAARRLRHRGQHEQRARRQRRPHRDTAADECDPPGHDAQRLLELAERGGIPSERRPVARGGAARRRRDPDRLAGGGIRAVTTLDGKPLATASQVPCSVYPRRILSTRTGSSSRHCCAE